MLLNPPFRINKLQAPWAIPGPRRCYEVVYSISSKR
jgi:hypothetical protein